MPVFIAIAVNCTHTRTGQSDQDHAQRTARWQAAGNAECWRQVIGTHKRREVAVAHDGLWVLADHRVVEQVEQARAAPAAAVGTVPTQRRGNESRSRRSRETARETVGARDTERQREPSESGILSDSHDHGDLGVLEHGHDVRRAVRVRRRVLTVLVERVRRPLHLRTNNAASVARGRVFQSRR